MYTPLLRDTGHRCEPRNKPGYNSVMQTVSYVVSGGAGGALERKGTVADLLRAIPYLLMARIVPPLHVTNDLLARGGTDAGMSGGCTWNPLQIEQEEWDDLRRHLTSLPDEEACEFVQPPEWVQTVDDWNAWIMIFRY